MGGQVQLERPVQREQPYENTESPIHPRDTRHPYEYYDLPTKSKNADAGLAAITAVAAHRKSARHHARRRPLGAVRGIDDALANGCNGRCSSKQTAGF